MTRAEELDGARLSVAICVLLLYGPFFALLLTTPHTAVAVSLGLLVLLVLVRRLVGLGAGPDRIGLYLAAWSIGLAPTLLLLALHYAPLIDPPSHAAVTALVLPGLLVAALVLYMVDRWSDPPPAAPPPPVPSGGPQQPGR